MQKGFYQIRRTPAGRGVADGDALMGASRRGAMFKAVRPRRESHKRAWRHGSAMAQGWD